MNRERLKIFVLIDALGWEYVRGRSFLDDVLPYRTGVKTILGFSSGAIPTILTGVPPAQNGHWNLLYYDPHGSPFRWIRGLQFLPDRVLDSRLSRKLIKELGKRVLGMGSTFECCVNPRLMPWFNWVEKRSIYEPGGIAGARSIFDKLTEEGVSYRAYSYHKHGDSDILALAVREIATSRATFFFIYLSEMDLFLHWNCSREDTIDDKLCWYERELRNVFAAAQARDPRAEFAVCSDHGMTPVRHTYDLVGDIQGLKLRCPEDYLAVYDSTMARFWFFTPLARQSIAERLNSVSCGRSLSDDALQRLGIFFSDHRYGDLVFVLNPGWLLARSDFNGSGWCPSGMHGYDPDDPYSDAIFLSNTTPVHPVTTIAAMYDWMMQ